MPVIATTGIVYGLIATNAYDRQKFQAGSQTYTPMRVVTCPLGADGRPARCSVTTNSLALADKSKPDDSYFVPPVGGLENK